MSDAPDRKPVRAVTRDPALDAWVGLWVAVKNGEVIAAEATSRALVKKVVEMGERGRGAVAQFVPPRSDVIVIGVG